MSRRNLQGRRVLITGASSGIGWHLALQLVARGSRVLATARRVARLEELRLESVSQATHNGGSLEYLCGDITDAVHRKEIRGWIDEHWHRFDVLINNAGSGAIGRFDEATPERLRKVMEVDFFAPVELTRSLLPLLKKGDQPALLNIGSVLAFRAVPRKSEYCAAKFALRGWSQSLRVELARDGVDVLQVHPSTTKSEFFESLTDTAANEKSASVGSMLPDDVAKCIVTAIVSSRRETILSRGGRFLVWAAQRFPHTLDRALAKFG